MEIETKVRVNVDTLPLQRYTLRKEDVIKNVWYVGGFSEGWEGSQGTYYLCANVWRAYLCGRGLTQADIVIDERYVEAIP